MRKLGIGLLMGAFLAVGCNNSTSSTTPSPSGIGKGTKDLKNKSGVAKEPEVPIPGAEKKADEKKPEKK